jgi:hypothetical protein
MLTLVPRVVVHTCNSRYSGGRGRKMENSRPAKKKLVKDPISKNNQKKRERKKW